MSFRHPANGYTIRIRHPFLWCLLFGCFYLMKHDAWGHAITALLLSLATAGVAWFVYPFFARRIVRSAYMRRGWIEA